VETNLGELDHCFLAEPSEKGVLKIKSLKGISSAESEPLEFVETAQRGGRVDCNGGGEENSPDIREHRGERCPGSPWESLKKGWSREGCSLEAA